MVVAAKKGLAVFHRLFDRVKRVSNGGEIPADAPDMDRHANNLLETEYSSFPRAVLGLKMKFLEAMDDDFNTAGAIAVMHEMAGEINAFVERHNIEHNKQPELVAGVVAARQTLYKLGQLLGLFRPEFERQQPADTTVTDQLMDLLIKLRAEARAAKDFQTADAIRTGLAEIGISLEDRPDGTGWRKD